MSTNGDGAVQGPRIQRREQWIDLPPEYDGFRVKIWVNAPTKFWTALSSEDESEALNGMQKIVLEHNGWLDFDGEPYPPAGSPELWEEVPTELAACVLVAAQTAMSDLPNSLRPTRQRSRRR
jgi:hypothetical protein